MPRSARSRSARSMPRLGGPGSHCSPGHDGTGASLRSVNAATRRARAPLSPWSRTAVELVEEVVLARFQGGDLLDERGAVLGHGVGVAPGVAVLAVGQRGL